MRQVVETYRRDYMFPNISCNKSTKPSTSLSKGEEEDHLEIKRIRSELRKAATLTSRRTTGRTGTWQDSGMG